MSEISDGSIDMVMTDPPYGTTVCKWDSVIPLDDMWAQLKRVAKPNCAIVLMAAQPFTSVLISSNYQMFKYDWVWRKPKGTGHLNAKKQPMRDKEDIAVFYSKQCTYNPQKTRGEPYKDKAGKDHSKATSMTDSYGAYTNKREDNCGFRYPKQVQDFPVVERGTLHPTQKPVALMEYLIKTYTNEGATVLDFAMGSGTTGVACKNLNRNFIGIELDEEYYSIAQQRINGLPLKAVPVIMERFGK
jgi:DNA modification methylase